MPGPTRAFLSYSHDGGEHSAAVLALANRLREDGVDASIDVYMEAPREGWPRWVTNQIDSADFVLCVCSENYRIAFEGRNPHGKKLGVNQEGYLITQTLYNAANQSDKYLAVLIDPAQPDSIPAALSGFTYYRLPQEYEKLYRRLTGQPAIVKPPIGSVRQLGTGPLPVQSNGFRLQAEVTAPETMPLERLAPREGLFLSRVINPQVRGGKDVISTVWLAANGPRQYIVDSIRIRDVVVGWLGPSGVAAEPPDAEYRFTFIENADQTHALNPALSIGPESRNRASFTLGVSPGSLLYGMGSLRIWLFYHTLDGVSGTILLQEPAPEIARLARIAEADILVAVQPERGVSDGEIAVTAGGLQRGLDSTNRPELEYEPMDLPEWNWLSRLDRGMLLAARSKSLRVLERRRSLHQALASPGKLGQLRKWMDEGAGAAARSQDDFQKYSPLITGARTAAGLIGGMATPEATAVLTAALQAEPLEYAPLYGLCVRHLATGDGMLASHAIKNHARLAVTRSGYSSISLETIASVIALKPGPGSLDLFLLLAVKDPLSARDLISAVQEDVDPAQFDRVFSDPRGPLAVDIFLRGTMNDWNTSLRLSYLGGGLYQAVQLLDAGRYEFKIADDRWLHVDLGARVSGEVLNLEQPLPLFSGSRYEQPSSNIVLDLTGASRGEYTFIVNVTTLAHPTVTVSPMPGNST